MREPVEDLPFTLLGSQFVFKFRFATTNYEHEEREHELRSENWEV